MKKPTYRDLAVETVSLLVFLTVAFLAGEYVAHRTGTVWWGAAAGAAVFLGIIYGMILWSGRMAEPARTTVTPSQAEAETIEPGTPPGVAEISGFLVLFLGAYFVGHGVARWTGQVGFGLVAAVATFIGIVVGFVRLFVVFQRMEAEAAAAPQPAPFSGELTWAEPVAFRQSEMKEAKKSVFGIVGCTVGLTVVAVGVAAWFHLGAEAYRKLLVTSGGLVVMLLMMGAMGRWMRVALRITGKGIVRDFGRSQETYKFGAIHHCEIGQMLIGTTMYPVLVIALKNRDREIYCIGDGVPAEDVRRTLEQRGVKVAMRSDTMSESILLGETEDLYAQASGLDLPEEAEEKTEERIGTSAIGDQ